MNITDVRIRPVEKEDSKMKAVASITIDGEFVVHDIKVIESDKGLFIAMPSKKDGNNEYKDVAHPIKTATRMHIQDTILAKYAEVIGETE
jgi:stage V sporulation protein G